MQFIFYKGYESYQPAFEQIVNNFTTQGIIIGDPNRNTVKAFEVNGAKFNFKSFKIPNLINKIAYRHFRKSKARRSFEYACQLLDKGIGTPQPIAYLERTDAVGLTSSFYVSEHLENIFTLRDVISDPAFIDREQIIRLYTAFFFKMHEQHIFFKDNSPGNVLIEKEEAAYKLFLVDLNRMDTNREMSMQERLGNFCRLTDDHAVLNVIADEYAKLATISPTVAYNLIIASTEAFLKKAASKRRLKKALRLSKK